MRRRGIRTARSPARVATRRAHSRVYPRGVCTHEGVLRDVCTRGDVSLGRVRPWGCFAGNMHRRKGSPGNMHQRGCPALIYAPVGTSTTVWADMLVTWSPRTQIRDIHRKFGRIRWALGYRAQTAASRWHPPARASAPHPSAKPTPQPAFPLMAFSRPPANRSLLSLAVKSPTASMVLPWVAFSRRNDPLSMPSRTLRTIR